MLPRNFIRSLTTRPWFVDPPYILPLRATALAPPLPDGVPGQIQDLHKKLSQSPQLDLPRLLVTRPVTREAGPPLPERRPQGRRNRGGTYAGESAYDIPGGVWDWMVVAQVKEGTENRGGIESVVRLVRKTLLESQIVLAPNSRKRMHNGWAMVDAGSFAVHVLSRGARETYFADIP